MHHNNADTIFIRQLKVRTLVGILPHERLKKQTLIINIALQTDFSQAQNSDNIADALDYSAISHFIIEFAEQAQYKLIERFADQLCQAIFANFNTNSIRIDIQKPAAIPHTREIGLSLTRQKQNLP